MIILLLLVTTTTTAVKAQDYWQRAVVNYTRQSYRSGNQNWQACQSREGWMYFANNKGLLEFDGSNWTTFPLPGNAKVRAVRVIGDTIYIGALGQFGHFTRNKKGRLTYERLSESVDIAGQTNIWHIHQIGHDIYYQSDGAFFINDGQTKLDCLTGISYSTVVYNRLYTVSSRGISVLVGKQFQLLKGIDNSLVASIVSILPWKHGQLLFVSSSQGLFVYSNNHLEPLPTAADDLISGERVSTAALSKDYLALGTMQGGVVLLNLHTNSAEQITIASGLQNKTVLSTTFDRDQNLWLGLDNGIDCIPLQSPLRYLNSRQSPIGSGYCSISYNNKLYLGTNQGLYEMSNGQIRFIEGTGSQVLCLDTIDGKLFCGGRQFFLSFDKDRITHYNARGVWGVRSVGYRDDILLTASYWGLRLMRRKGTDWQMAEEIKGTDISAKSFYLEDSSGAVWVANKEKGIYRLVLSDDLLNVTSQKCHNSLQLPKGDNVSIAKIDGETVIASRQGLFRYNSTKDKLEPYSSLEERLEGHTSYSFIRQEKNGDIWYATDGIIHLMRGKQNSGFLYNYLIEDFESVSLWNHYAIIGTEEGFASIKLNQSGGYPISLPASQEYHMSPRIRRIYIGNYTDTLFYGCQEPVIVPWRDHSLRFEYSTANYDPSQTVLYSYCLEGSTDKDWSPYSRSRIKEYTNLPEGDYTFRLRIMTKGNQKPVETRFRFTILPPWYRTWWAYLLYTLGFLAFCYLGYRRLRKSRQQLIQQKDEQIQEREEQIETLQEEKLEIELRSKQDELVRSRMNIVRKNEMLQEIRNTAVSLNNAIPSANDPKPAEALSTIKRRVVRLIGQIDTNIEHDDDLDAFHDSFDAVHHNFLKILDERYPDLSRKEKMLCAYIRMGLQSKEIAPLQNISTRGVEISRYRIRQKLGLDKNASLTEFLQHL